MTIYVDSYSIICLHLDRCNNVKNYNFPYIRNNLKKILKINMFLKFKNILLKKYNYISIIFHKYTY